MARLLGRKLLLILSLLPLLNLLGYQYAVAHPRYNPSVGASLLTLGRYSEMGFPSYVEYVRQLAHGSLGDYKGVPIGEVLKEPVRNSLWLLGIALLASALIGPGLGLASVSRRTLRTRTWALLLYTAGLSMPGFLLGVLAIGAMIYASLQWGPDARILPLSGYGLDEHLILPVLVLASRPTLQVARLTANLLENELQQDYMRVAKSKGLDWARLLWRHAFSNTASAVAVAIGHSSRLLISGLVIVETLFLWPGVGRLLMYDLGIRSDGRADLSFFAHPQLLAALAVVFGAMLLFSDLIASILAYWLDPRQRNPVGDHAAPR